LTLPKLFDTLLSVISAMQSSRLLIHHSRYVPDVKI
jgi:hypothetical protein